MSRNVRIVSRQNERIREAKKLAQKKHRDATGRFCLEGVRLVEEALTASLVEELFYGTPSPIPQGRNWCKERRPVPSKCMNAVNRF